MKTIIICLTCFFTMCYARARCQAKLESLFNRIDKFEDSEDWDYDRRIRQMLKAKDICGKAKTLRVSLFYPISECEIFRDLIEDAIPRAYDIEEEWCHLDRKFLLFFVLFFFIFTVPGKYTDLHQNQSCLFETLKLALIPDDDDRVLSPTNLTANLTMFHKSHIYCE